MSEANYTRSIIDRFNLHEILSSWGIDIRNAEWKQSLSDEDNQQSLGEFNIGGTGITVTVDDLLDSENKEYITRSSTQLRSVLTKVRNYVFLEMDNGVKQLWVRRSNLFVMAAEFTG